MLERYVTERKGSNHIQRHGRIGLDALRKKIRNGMEINIIFNGLKRFGAMWSRAVS